MTTTQAHGFGCQILERRLRAEEVQDVEDHRGIGQSRGESKIECPDEARNGVVRHELERDRRLRQSQHTHLRKPVRDLIQLAVPGRDMYSVGRQDPCQVEHMSFACRTGP